jgi:glycosyltransferase involved in cell wall biosynthesis
MAKLTVIMPVYNAAPFVREAVESILSQTFQDFELWIVDDSSTDNSLTIIDSFQDDRIKLRRNSINRGRVVTVNAVVNEINSPYFTITDADDVSHPTRLEKQVGFLDSHPDYAMCGTSFWAIDENGFLVREMKLKTDVVALRAAALHQSQFLGPTTMMRRSVLQNFPDFYRPYFTDYYADADLSCRILDWCHATNLDEPLYFYRIVHSSISRTDITPFKLNCHKLVGLLSLQRRSAGQDCLQRGETAEVDAFMDAIQSKYDTDPSLFLRHQAFFHLYWGLNSLALTKGWQAFVKNPFFYKNMLSVFVIVLRIVWYWLNRVANKKSFRMLVTQ